MPQAADAVNAPFEDSRRLTGANLYFDLPGAVLETAPGLGFDAATLQRWRGHVARARAALGWPDGPVGVREHATGASLAFAAPADQLYVATEANEWAWYAALGLRAGGEPVDADDPEPRPHVAHFDDDEALSRLRAMARAEANPGLLRLLAAARERGVPAHADDEAVSIGEGVAARTWPVHALPAPGEVDWAGVQAVPKAVVTGSNGKTTTVRLLAAILEAHGWCTGFSSTEGLVVGGERVAPGDYSGPVGARTVLRHPRVRAAVLETARGGLLRRGLEVRDARVAVVTNVSDDHFGEYGIHDIDALAEAKLLVARALAPDGVLVLNADDPRLVRGAGAAGGHALAWFALRLDDAGARGPLACGVRDGQLRLLADAAVHELGEVATMPLAFGGSATYNIANAAAASLAAWALGVAPATIAAVLARFGDDPRDNPGRLQRWQLGDVRVLLDYAHNPEGLGGLLRVAEGLRGGGRMGLLLGQAGNRGDDAIRALARAALAARPDRVWLKDIGGEYLRGREPGAIAAILSATLQEAGMGEDALPVCLDESMATREALRWARPGDLLVLPIHEPAHRATVVALLDRLRAEGWHAGQPVPEAD